jgi:hypothetical protein
MILESWARDWAGLLADHLDGFAHDGDHPEPPLPASAVGPGGRAWGRPEFEVTLYTGRRGVWVTFPGAVAWRLTPEVAHQLAGVLVTAAGFAETR